MKPYKIKHIPTGLYFQPKRYRGSNLSKFGKIYQTANHGLIKELESDEPFYVFLHQDSIVYKYLLEKGLVTDLEEGYGYKELKLKTSKKDWELTEI